MAVEAAAPQLAGGMLVTDLAGVGGQGGGDGDAVADGGVELVGDAGHQRAQRGHPVLADQLFLGVVQGFEGGPEFGGAVGDALFEGPVEFFDVVLGAAQFGDVHYRPQRAVLPVDVEQAPRDQAGQHVGVAGPVELDLALEDGVVVGEALVDPLPVGEVHPQPEFERAAVADRVPVQAEQLLPGGVGIQVGAVAHPGEGEGAGGRVEDRREAGFGLPEPAGGVEAGGLAARGFGLQQPFEASGVGPAAPPRPLAPHQDQQRQHQQGAGDQAWKGGVGQEGLLEGLSAGRGAGRPAWQSRHHKSAAGGAPDGRGSAAARRSRRSA